MPRAPRNTKSTEEQKSEETLLDTAEKVEADDTTQPEGGSTVEDTTNATGGDTQDTTDGSSAPSDDDGFEDTEAPAPVEKKAALANLLNPQTPTPSEEAAATVARPVAPTGKTVKAGKGTPKGVVLVDQVSLIDDGRTILARRGDTVTGTAEFIARGEKLGLLRKA